ncbi:unnamed protein product [Diatraea saccharalis]|uniref:Uncharacterized protein n=1 Tax=Diatraea saccharalis TaxID=40085 RepID=A0A9N9QU58_9NEOP|nr:unnamed protein product [Diatraea saccharalis]
MSGRSKPNVFKVGVVNISDITFTGFLYFDRITYHLAWYLRSSPYRFMTSNYFLLNWFCEIEVFRVWNIPIYLTDYEGTERIPVKTLGTGKRHRFTVEIPQPHTKRFASTFIVRTAKLWNLIPDSLFPDKYSLGLFKSKVNRFLLGKHAPS